MIRTQVQLPDEVYRRLEELAASKGWSIAETLRRGAELLLRSHAANPAPAPDWQLPAAVSLGEFTAPVDRWRELANARGADDA